MERRCLAGSPWAVQACVDLSLLVVLGGRNPIAVPFHHNKPKIRKKLSKMRKQLKARNLRIWFQKNLSAKTRF